jgi:hypothetical protein
MQERQAMESPVVGPDHITKIAHAFRAAKTLLSAVELGVFTVLAEVPLDRDTLGRGSASTSVAPAIFSMP